MVLHAISAAYTVNTNIKKKKQNNDIQSSY